MPKVQSTIYYWALGLILAVSLALRLWGISFGLPNIHCRPDESTLVNKALSIGTGDLNPHFFNYPSLYFYLLAFVYGLFFALGRMGGAFAGIEDFQRLFFTDPSAFYLIGRISSALLGTASVGLTFLIGRRTGGARVGLLSAFFLSLVFLHVRDSHFLTVDIPATFYMLAGLVFALRYLERSVLGELLASAACFGLAASTKYNVALFGISTFVVAWLVARREKRTIPWSRWLWVAGVMGLVFVAGTPFSVLDFGSFWRDLTFERLHFAVGHGDPGLNLGSGWWYHLRFSLLHGLGWPLLGAALIGVGWMVWRRRPQDLALLSGLLVYYGMAGSGQSVFMRYMLPVVPLLCVAAGGLCDVLTSRRRNWALLLAVVLAAPGAHATWQHGRLLAREDTRLLAARWIEAEVPDGARIAMVGSDFGFPQVRRSRGWLQEQLEDAQATGQGGRRLVAMLALKEYPPPPSYYVVELKPENRLNRRAVWTTGDLTLLRAAGIAWVVTHEHPLAYSQVDPFLKQRLEEEAVLVRCFDPFQGSWSDLVYDPFDAYYVPVAGSAAVERPGPLIRVYRLNP